MNIFSLHCIQPCGASLLALEGQIARGTTAPDLLQVIENVQHRTGIAASHLMPLQNVAKEKNCIIGIRPVEAVATGLITQPKTSISKARAPTGGPNPG